MSGFEIEKARAVLIEAELARRRIFLQGRGLERAGPCPVCGGADRFSINVRKQLWNCRGCRKGGRNAIGLVQHLDRVSFRNAVALLAGEPTQANGQSRQAPNLPATVSPQPEDSRRQAALSIWHGAQDPRGTLVEAHFKSRALNLPNEAANEAIRFHGGCKFGSEWFPAMVCLVRNIVANEPQGVHRTALGPDGTAIKRDGKTFRLSLGQITGGVIKLNPDEDVEQGLCIGEGIETCLSGRQIGYRPVWSAVSKSGVASFPVLPGIVGLTIFGERDEKEQSEKSIRACAERSLMAGIETQAVWPLVGNDLNDEIRAA
jgi:putative DNA primase/helicase